VGIDLLGPFRVLLALALIFVFFGPGIWVVVKLFKISKKDPDKIPPGLIVVLGVTLTFIFVFALRVIFVELEWYDGPIFPT
jgi:hypothetical protein